jgi:hypothetical protein
MISLEQLQNLVKEGQYFFYTHALTEAKKDGVEPEDVVTAILTGKVIEEYDDRGRLLIYGMMTNQIPLHVVCDCSNEDTVIIITTYIPDRQKWVRSRIRKNKPRKQE